MIYEKATAPRERATPPVTKVHVFGCFWFLVVVVGCGLWEVSLECGRGRRAAGIVACVAWSVWVFNRFTYIFHIIFIGMLSLTK